MKQKILRRRPSFKEKKLKFEISKSIRFFLFRNWRHILCFACGELHLVNIETIFPETRWLGCKRSAIKNWAWANFFGQIVRSSFEGRLRWKKNKMRSRSDSMIGCDNWIGRGDAFMKRILEMVRLGY